MEGNRQSTGRRKARHWMPEQYSSLSRGGQDLVWGLASYEAEELAKK